MFLVENQSKSFSSPLKLESGKTLQDWTLNYECYGQLSAARDNAILVCHGLSGSAHAAGRYSKDDLKAGWWDLAIGPGKPIDTERYFVVCSNVLGGAGGSTGPASLNPQTGRAYGTDFPVVTVEDWVRAQECLARALGIEKFCCALGGCMGGFQVLTWARMFPERIGSMVIIGATSRTSTHSLAFFEVIRQAIRRDPNWRGGHYYDGKAPSEGLGLGSMIGLLFWMSPKSMQSKFGRTYLGDGPSYTLDSEFSIHKLMEQVGQGAPGKFDPNSMLYLTRALDYYDLESGYENFQKAMSKVKARSLLVSYKHDWRYPTSEMASMAEAFRKNGCESDHIELESDFAHAAFLFDLSKLGPAIKDFLGAGV